MRTALSSILILLLFPALAAAQGVELVSGQKVSAGFDDPSDFVNFRFHAADGDLLTLKVSGARGLVPYVLLTGPQDDIDLPEATNGRITLQAFPVPASGLHILSVYAAGTTGTFALEMKLKRPKPGTVTVPADSKFTIEVPSGAKVTFEAKAEKGSTVLPGIDALLDPLGNDVLDPTFRKEKGKKAKLVLPKSPHFGSYTLYLAAREGTGNVVLKTAVKPAKPNPKVLSEKNGYESLVVLRRAQDGKGGFEYGLNAEVLGSVVTSATLRFPAGSGLTDRGLDQEEEGDFRLELPGVFPDGVYTLFVDRGGVTDERTFVIGGSWPTELTYSLFNASSSRPQVTWAGGAGASFMYLAFLEEDDPDDWEEAFGVIVSAAGSGYTVPDGPLDPVAHGLFLMAISEGLKTTSVEYVP